LRPRNPWDATRQLGSGGVGIWGSADLIEGRFVVGGIKTGVAAGLEVWTTYDKIKDKTKNNEKEE